MARGLEWGCKRKPGGQQGWGGLGLSSLGAPRSQKPDRPHAAVGDHAYLVYHSILGTWHYDFCQMNGWKEILAPKLVSLTICEYH